MEYKGFKNKSSAIITAVSLIVVLVGTSVGSFNKLSTNECKGDTTYTQVALEEGYEIDLVEATISDEAK